MDVTGNGLNQLKMAGKMLEWLEMAGYGWTWLGQRSLYTLGESENIPVNLDFNNSIQ